MNAKVSISRQSSAVGIMIDILGGAKTKPRGSQLEQIIADARASQNTLIWLDVHKDAVLVAIGGETIGKAIGKQTA